MAVVMLCGNVMAFNWDAHRKITRTGLIGLDIDAMREVVAGNLSVDQGRLEKQRSPHFDSEHFSGGAVFIKDRLKKASQALASCDVHRARKMFGQALHPTQDFFSHSNWVEKNLNNPAATIDVTLLRDNSSTVRNSWIQGKCCRDMASRGCQNVPLTTGFMVRDNLLWRRCTHNQLNKDNESKKYFPQAVDRATRATHQIFKAFITSLVRQYGAEKTQDMVAAFAKNDEASGKKICSKAKLQTSCSRHQQQVIPGHITRVVEKIFQRLTDDELPPDIYN